MLLVILFFSNKLINLESPVIVLPRHQIKSLASFCSEKDNYFFNLWVKCNQFFGEKGILSEEQKNQMEMATYTSEGDPYSGDTYLNAFNNVSGSYKIWKYLS